MDPRVEQAIAILEQQLHTPIRLPALAAAVQLSVSQLTRLFRRDTGRTPAAHLHWVRMRHARILIERSSLSVAEVMTLVGITDPSHFARDFRDAHGFSPRAFRRHMRLVGRSVASDRHR